MHHAPCGDTPLTATTTIPPLFFFYSIFLPQGTANATLHVSGPVLSPLPSPDVDWLIQTPEESWEFWAELLLNLDLFDRLTFLG